MIVQFTSLKESGVSFLEELSILNTDYIISCRPAKIEFAPTLELYEIFMHDGSKFYVTKVEMGRILAMANASRTSVSDEPEPPKRKVGRPKKEKTDA